MHVPKIFSSTERCTDGLETPGPLAADAGGDSGGSLVLVDESVDTTCPTKTSLECIVLLPQKPAHAQGQPGAGCDKGLLLGKCSS